MLPVDQNSLRQLCENVTTRTEQKLDNHLQQLRSAALIKAQQGEVSLTEIVRVLG